MHRKTKIELYKIGCRLLTKDLVKICTFQKRAFGSSANLFVKISSGETPSVALGRSFCISK